MSRSEVAYWSKAWSRYRELPLSDGWLVEHLGLLSKSKDVPVLDLGCGSGRDTQFLVQKGFRVIACDFCPVALNVVKRHLPGASVVALDLQCPLPFATDRTLAIVSDLSLHYFDWATTLQIVKEMSRVLRRGGVLYCRVNSMDKLNYAGQGVEVEKHYYDIHGHFKRFFTEQEMLDLFRGWEVQKLDAYTLFSGRKHVIEIICTNVG